MTLSIRTAILAGLTVLAPSLASAQTVGMNAAVLNDVRMTTAANATLHRAVVRERVSLGNDILTGRASRLQVMLLDRTNFTVGPNARIKVDRFVYDPARKSSGVGVTVTRGTFRFMSGRPTHANPGGSAIRTPTASIGIRGTIVEGAVGPDAIRIAREQKLGGPRADPNTATLVMLRGPGPATQGGEIPGAIDVAAGGRTIQVTQPGYAVFIPYAGAEPIGPFRMWDCASAVLSAFLGLGGFGFDTPFQPDPNPLLDDLFFDEPCIPSQGQGPNDPAGGGCIPGRQRI